jgi:hypothetical protein
MSRLTDVHKFKILRKDLIIGIKLARTLDDLIALLERKVKEYNL